MTIKKLLTGIVLLLVLMWLSGELLLRSDERNAEMQKATLGTTTSEVAGISTTSLKLSLPAEKENQRAHSVLGVVSSLATTTQTPLVTSIALDGKEMMTVTLTVDGKKFVHKLPKGSSVASLLTLAQTSGEMSYVGKEYSGLGMLITEINGIANNQDNNNLYWIYSVNGQKATKGVSVYALTSGDTVSWSYEQNTY